MQQAYPQQFIWEKKYTTYPKATNSVMESFDFDRGNYFLGITRLSSNVPSFIMTDSEGTTVWANHFDDSTGIDKGATVKVHGGKAYFCPSRYMPDTTLKVQVIQFDKTGNKKLIHTYANNVKPFNYCETRSIIGKEENLFLAMQCGNSGLPGFESIVYAHLDTNGIKKDESIFFGGNILAEPTSLVNFNNEIAMYARLNPPPSLNYPFLMKLKKNGTIKDSSRIREVSLNYLNTSYGYDYLQWGQMIYDRKEGFYFTGTYTFKNKQNQNRGKFFIAKTDTNLNFKWVLRCSGQNEIGNSAQSRMNLLPNGNILLSGFETGNTGLRVYNVHPSGVILDSIRLVSKIAIKQYWYTTHSHYFAEDSTLAVSGRLDNDAYLAKVDLKKFLVLNTDKEAWASNTFSVSPNPCANYLHLQIPKQGILELYDMQGHLQQKHPVLENMSEIDISQLNTGVYLYRFSMEDGVRYGKIVKQ